MKVSMVQLHYRDTKQAKVAIDAILSSGCITKRDYAEQSVGFSCTDEELYESYTGPCFIEGIDCSGLHVLNQGDLICVNFIDEREGSLSYGKRISYQYPTAIIGRVRTVS